MGEASDRRRQGAPGSPAASGHRIDRRRLLRAAAASGVVWVAPTVSRVMLPAASAVGTPLPEPDDEPEPDVEPEPEVRVEPEPEVRVEPEPEIEPQPVDREVEPVVLEVEPAVEPDLEPDVEIVPVAEEVPKAGAETRGLLAGGAAALAGGTAMVRATRPSEGTDPETAPEAG